MLFHLALLNGRCPRSDQKAVVRGSGLELLTRYVVGALILCCAMCSTSISSAAGIETNIARGRRLKDRRDYFGFKSLQGQLLYCHSWSPGSVKLFRIGRPNLQKLSVLVLTLCASLCLSLDVADDTYFRALT